MKNSHIISHFNFPGFLNAKKLQNEILENNIILKWTNDDKVSKINRKKESLNPYTLLRYLSKQSRWEGNRQLYTRLITDETTLNLNYEA